MPNDRASSDLEEGQPTEPMNTDATAETLPSEKADETTDPRLEEANAKAEDYWQRLLRLQADHDNVLRRHERELANAHKYAIDRFVLELLPIIDGLELCVTGISSENQAAMAALFEGVNMTLKMFHNAMEKFGISQISPLHQPFNPEQHQAIATQVDAQFPAGMVLAVLQKGYALNGRLIRPALVTVSKAEE